MDAWERIAREEQKRARLGPYACCEGCGETELSCLQQTRIRSADGQLCAVVLCANCRLIQQGKQPSERHHVAARRNDPTTALIPANEHALLSHAQHDWPEETLRNLDGSPLLRAAGALRGWLDVLQLIIERTVGWIPMFLEQLDRTLRTVMAPRWWEAPGMEGMRQWTPQTNTR
jgi:hypothetical protein